VLLLFVGWFAMLFEAGSWHFCWLLLVCYVIIDVLGGATGIGSSTEQGHPTEGIGR